MTSPQSDLLVVNNLRSGYGRVEVLRGINLAVREGELVALLGSNGAGKTTFNHTVCGLVRAWTVSAQRRSKTAESRGLSHGQRYMKLAGLCS